MPWIVEEDLCTGCELCCEQEGFLEFDEDTGKARMIKPDAPKDQAECIEAAEDCPTEAVVWED